MFVYDVDFSQTTNSLLHWFFILFFVFPSYWFRPSIFCLVILLGVFTSFCSRDFKCAVKLLVWDLCNFFIKALSVNDFPLSAAFIVSHKFRNVVHLFSLNTRKSLMFFFLFLSWPSDHSLRSYSVSCGRRFSIASFVLQSIFSPRWLTRTECYFNFILSIETCFVTKYVGNFEECSVWCWEVCLFFYVWVKCSADID